MMPSRPLRSASSKNFVPNVFRSRLKAISLCFGRMDLRRFFRSVSGNRAKVFSILKHEIECEVAQLRLAAEGVLQQLKMRDAFFVERHELAVDHGVAFHAFERFRDFDVAMADDLAVAAIERDLARC